jgi:dihydrofolate reductase
MGKLIYALNVSLDGYVETADHAIDWANVDDELHTWFNDLARELDASLYGRRMYELMAAYWPTAGSDPAATEGMLDFARIWIETPKVVHPVILGAGTPFFPQLETPIRLRLTETRRFESGVMYLSYAAA